MKRTSWVLLAVLSLCVATGRADTWPMKQRDIHRTGRASFVIPTVRLNDTLFNALRWQKPAPGSPGDGNVGSSSMAFFDGVGPDGADLVVAGYHWPKGVQGMDRHTGRKFWDGNPDGGESIGNMTAAFSNDGATLYITNDASDHPLMAFVPADGPASYWHNGADPDPWHFGPYSPIVAPDGRIFGHSWNERPYAATDTGSALVETWAAASSLCECYSNPTLYDDAGTLLVITAGRCGDVKAFDGDTGAELWSVPMGHDTDADATVDPDNGHIYLLAGGNSIYVIGLDIVGTPLWGTNPSVQLFEWIDGVNDPQRAQSGGCLSHDGATYYAQTVGSAGNGRLYAVNTADGSLKWELETGSAGWEMTAACPIVTPNGVVIVGNNGGATYYAVQDTGSAGVVLDTFVTDGAAESSATLSTDGLLYLPLRTTWIATNGDGDSPTYVTENVFSCFDLTEDPTTSLPPPADLLAVALNQAVQLSWRPIVDPLGQFDHYAIYRDTAPFTSVSGMTPLATESDVATVEFVDTTAVNGQHYYYAVTAVATGGGEFATVQSTGPRTPRDETDLQVLSVSRTPRFPRYLPEYSWYEITEPSGFGPYGFSAATSLGGGQDEATQRWPNVGDPVTYTATIRNRGTNPWNGTLSGAWSVDSLAVSLPSQAVALAPGDTATFTYVMNWDDLLHDVEFALTVNDARATNNIVTIGSKSAPFLTYVDVGFVEDFRELSTPNYPLAATDDMLDWLQRHAVRMNAMFAAAGSGKRVHYDVLELTRDGDPDPAVDATPFGIFPFRYYADPSSDPRSPGYYDATTDIDNGLCHEMSHQLGLIDIYQFDLPPENNLVSSMGYTAVPCMMHGCSPFYSEHSARAMSKWIDIVHGYYGQYMYDLPAQVRLRVLGFDGQPLVGATVKMYQMVDRPGLGKVITDQIKAQGVTDASGEWTLPNVPIDPNLVPPTPAGELHDNPFGYLSVVGTNGLLHFKVEYDEFVDYAWLDVTEVNVAYWQGQTAVATFERQLAIGGAVQHYPPADMTELNAASWSSWAQDGTITLSDDTAFKQVGQSSLKGEFTGGFDNYIRYPAGLLAKWDLSGVTAIHFWVYAVNPNGGFQNLSPWVRVGTFQDGYYQWTPSWEVLNDALGQWREVVVPIAGDDTWARTTFGSPDLAHMNYLEFHADTWGYGFTLWFDDIRFDPQPHRAGDLNCDGQIDFADINPFVDALLYGIYCDGTGLNADVNGNGSVGFEDINPFVDLLLGNP